MDLDDMREGFLRIGRSLSQPSLLDLLETEGALSRKRRDVSHAPSEEEEGLKRTTRGISEGYLRFGRGGDSALTEGGALEGPAAAKRGDVVNGDREYLRFGRGGQSNFPRWGKRYLRFGRGHSEGFLRFGKKSS